MSKRILYVSSSRSVWFESQDAAEHFAAAPYSVDAIGYNLSKLGWNVGWAGWQTSHNPSTLARRIDEFRPDIIYTYGSILALVPLFCRKFLCRHKAFKVIHGWDDHYGRIWGELFGWPGKLLMDWMEKRIVKNSDGVVTLSYELQKIGRTWGVECHYIPNGADPIPTTFQTSQTSQTFKLTGTFNLVYTGDKARWKRTEDICRAMRELPKDVKLYLTGKNEDYLKPYASENCIFLGWLSKEDQLAVMSQADAFVCTSDQDCNAKLQEYLRWQKPILGLDGEANNFFHNGHNALLAPNGDYAPLVRRLIDEPDLGSTLAANAVKEIPVYTWAEIAAQFDAYFGHIKAAPDSRLSIDDTEIGRSTPSLLSRLHARLGDFWWYSILMFAALRVGDVINAVVGLWLVPKYVSPEELGAVMPLMSFSAFVGYPMAVLVTVFSRYLSKFETEGDEGRIKSALRWFIGSAIVFNLATCALSVLAMPHFFERIRVTEGSLGLLILLAGTLGPLSLVFSRALQGLKKFKTITFINLLSAPIRLGVMLVALPIRALSGYMLGQVASPLFCIATAWFALRRNVRKSIASVPFWRGQGREVIRYFSVIFLSMSIGSVSAFVLPLIIRQRLPDVESAAYYMITRFAELGTYASVTLTFVMFPLASSAHAKGKDPLRLFLQTAAGSLGFGVLVSLALYFCGGFVFELLPTCRPYAAYVTDMALLAFSMALGAACGNFSDYEFACSRFRFLWWNLPLTIAQTVFAVAFTGYGFFRGIFPDAVVDWMGSLHLATLRNFIWMLIIVSFIRIAAIILHLTIRKFKVNGPNGKI